MKKEVKQYVGNDGHYYVRLVKDGVSTEHKVCELVWVNFVGKIPQGYSIGHIDGDKSNNSLVNLKLIEDGSCIS